MRHRALLFLTTASLLVGTPVRANEPTLNLFRDYLESLRVQAGIPGLSAALIGRDDIIWEHAFGSRDLERNLPATPDTPFHLDGLTQLITATLVLRCVEDGLFSLDTPLSELNPGTNDSRTTVRGLLTHTSTSAGGAVFDYDPDRLRMLPPVIRRVCTGNSFRETLSNELDQLSMSDSVPGPDVVRLVRPAEGIPSASQRERYTRTLDRLATPYAVNSQKRATRSTHPVTTLTPYSGLISTVRDFAKFDLALKDGDLLDKDTLEDAWVAPVGRGGSRLPHGSGWFVQTYNGELIVWQFGVSDDASSSLAITVPGRGLTLILLANSDGLVRPFALERGDLVASPFGRLFLGLLVR
jgi:CubicO group peptidase (beta-lactamase class C family)